MTAFPGGEGTADMVEQARARNVQVYETPDRVRGRPPQEVECMTCNATYAAKGTYEWWTANLVAGELSFCHHCGALAVFADYDLTLRAPTPDEAQAIAADPDLQALQARWATWQAKQ